LIVLFDVLEHIEEDVEVLQILKSRLKPGGCLLLTVPALPALWSYHDDIHHHFRRYRKGELAKRVLEGGYELTTVSYFNTLLFPLVAAVRLLKRLSGKVLYGDLVLPQPWLNGLLKWTFATERHVVGIIPLPIGVSLLAVARA
jgi:SAM-dependent methyltransferase